MRSRTADRVNSASETLQPVDIPSWSMVIAIPHPSRSISTSDGVDRYDGWYVTSNIVTGGYSWSDVNYQAAVIGISPTPLPTVTSVTATPLSPQVAGTPITVTATVTGGVPPYQVKWWVWNGSAWSVGQDWNPSTTFVWTPQAAGAYELPRLGPQYRRDRGHLAGLGPPRVHGDDQPGGVSTAGWPDAIVVAAGSGVYMDAGTYVRGQTYFLSFAVGNYGTGATLGRYYVAVYDNDVLIGTGYVDAHLAGYYVYWPDNAYAFSTAGTHVLKMVIDSTNAIPETNEADNVYSKALFVN